MPQEVTMTAAKAIIKVNGVAVGLMKNLQITESKQRGSVMGLGRVTKSERPLLAITCTWSCSFYMIDLKKSGIPGIDNRVVQTAEQYTDTQVLLPPSVDVVVYKRDIKEVTGGVVTSTKNSVFCVLKDVYLDSTNCDVTEQSVSGLSQSGEYLTPCILSV